MLRLQINISHTTAQKFEVNNFLNFPTRLIDDDYLLYTATLDWSIGVIAAENTLLTTYADHHPSKIHYCQASHDHHQQ